MIWEQVNMIAVTWFKRFRPGETWQVFRGWQHSIHTVLYVNTSQQLLENIGETRALQVNDITHYNNYIPEIVPRSKSYYGNTCTNTLVITPLPNCPYLSVTTPAVPTYLPTYPTYLNTYLWLFSGEQSTIISAITVFLFRGTPSSEFPSIQHWRQIGLLTSSGLRWGGWGGGVRGGMGWPIDIRVFFRLFFAPLFLLPSLRYFLKSSPL